MNAKPAGLPRMLIGFWYVTTSLSSIVMIVFAIGLFMVMARARSEIVDIQMDVTAMKTDLTAIRVIYDTIDARLRTNRLRPEAPR